MANRRYIDFPIASSVGDSDIILIWQSGANKQTTKATFLSGLPENLDELNDVAISGLTNGQILRYDSVTGKWENTDQGNLDLNDLNDVSIVSPSNGQVLVYNSSTSKWENSSGGYVPYTGAVTTVNLGAQTIQAGSFVKAGGTAAQFLKANGSVDSNVYGTGTVTSVALTMPTAFTVGGSPITTAGTLAVTGAGTVGQYIRGDGSLADFPESSGGGSSVSYYLNGSVAQGTIGGVAYKELNKVPILGAGTDFTINADGYIASFITDAGDPNLLEIPAGNWNFETYFSASSGGGSPTFYVELYKVNSGGTATLIASNSTFPELIAFGTNIISYFSTLAVPTTTLALTDRLAIRYYVTHSGRTITLHTEDNHLCQIITTFTTGLTALNGLTAQIQNFAVGTSGTDFAIASATATHTFNLPTASATNRGALSSADWTTFNGKQNALTNPVTGTGTSGQVAYFTGTSAISSESNLFWDATNDRLGIGTNIPATPLHISTSGLPLIRFTAGSESRVHNINSLNNGRDISVLPFRSFSLITGNGIAEGQIVLNAYEEFIVGTGSSYTSRFIIDTSGRTSIGYTTNPSNYQLDVNGIARFGSNTFKVLSISDAGGAGWATTGGASTSPQVYLFSTGTSALVQTYINSVSKFEVSNAGISVNGSGTFNSDFVANETSKVGISFASGYGQINSWGANTSTYGGLKFQLSVSNGGTFNALTLAPSGTATFISSITAGGTQYLVNTSTGTNQVYQRILNTGGDVIIGINANTGAALATGGLAYATAIYNNTNTALQFGTNAAFNMTIAAGGNVGIGRIPSSGYKVDIQGSGGLRILDNDVLRSIVILPPTSSSQGVVSTASGQGISFQATNASGNLTFETAGNERMRITSGGSVGINNTSPMNSAWGSETSTKQLSINGSSYAVINLEGSTGRKYSMGVGDGNFYMCYDNTAGRHNIVVSSGGNILIGTATSGSSKLRLIGLPTSAVGLSSGDVYNLAGTLMIA